MIQVQPKIAMSGCALFDCNASDFLGSFADKSVDCIVTDPAYWTLEKHRNTGTTTRLGGAGKMEDQEHDKWFKTIDESQLYRFLDECFRVLKQDSHAWVMCDGQTMAYMLGHVAAGKTGFKYFKPYPVIKRASTGGYRAGMGYHGRCSHEYVVLLEKGRNRFKMNNRIEWPDVFDELWNGDAVTKRYTPDGAKFPTAKPVSLYQKFIEYSTREGDFVIDPFGGSGTIVAATHNTNRQCATADISQYALTTIQNRMRAFQNPNYTE